MHQLTTLRKFFAPRTIAIVGASAHPNKLGHTVLLNILEGGFTGKLFAVNPTLPRFNGVKTVTTVQALPRSIDLVVIVTPASTVPAIVSACAKAGHKNIVIISAGFREVGGEGEKLEESVRSSVERYHLNLLGPNCLGMSIGSLRLNATFAAALPKEGNVTILSQSGAMAVALIDWAKVSGVAIHAMVSMGNKAGLDEVDLVRQFARDPKTDVIVLYLESLTRGQDFLAACASILPHKPIIVLKAGQSDEGKKAIAFHTGSLAGSDDVFRAAMQHSAVIQVDRIESLYDTARLAAAKRLPLGNRIAVLTNAGGPGIMAADAVSATRLAFAQLAATTCNALRKKLPAAASIENPVDIIGDADVRRFTFSLKTLLHDANVDMVLVTLTPQVVLKPLAVAKELVRLQRTTHKVIVASFLGGASVASARRYLHAHGIPHCDVPEDAIAALDRLAHYASKRKQKVPRDIPVPLAKSKKLQALVSNKEIILSPEADSIFRILGVATPKSIFVQYPSAVTAAARKIGFPVALKWISPRLVHKTEHHAVWPSIANTAELALALRKMSLSFRSSRYDEGWLVQKHIENEHELFVGAKRDPSFGPVVLVGVGGVDIALHRTVVTLLPPFTSDSIIRSLRESPLAPWLLERRGRCKVPLSILADVARRVGNFLRVMPQVVEIDVNPLFVTPKGACVAADIRIRIATST